MARRLTARNNNSLSYEILITEQLVIMSTTSTTRQLLTHIQVFYLHCMYILSAMQFKNVPAEIFYFINALFILMYIPHRVVWVQTTNLMTGCRFPT